jgi:nicotinate-nucleotide pyrophosphorylase (carboxylating)
MAMSAPTWTADLAAAARQLVGVALAEDHAQDDITTRVSVAPTRPCCAAVVARQPLVPAGLPIVPLAMQTMDAEAQCELLAQDGERVAAGTTVARIRGRAWAVLAVERTLLNILQRLCGVATLTRAFVDAVAGTGCAIVDTRKTTPGLRLLEKYAVRCGGGRNHRLHLGDMVMIKDNHWLLAGADACALVTRARAQCPQTPIAAEAESIEAARALLDAGVDLLMLDNMPAEAMRAVAQLCKGRVPTEATGGVTLATVRAVAETGVDRISIGALTHSAPAVDIALDVIADTEQA